MTEAIVPELIIEVFVNGIGKGLQTLVLMKEGFGIGLTITFAVVESLQFLSVVTLSFAVKFPSDK